MSYLSIEHLDKSFVRGNLASQVLKDINLNIAKGEFISIIGHSGCGKSTVLNIVAGLLDPSLGGVILDGKEVRGPGPDRSMVFQNHSLLPWLTVYENVEVAVNKLFKRSARALAMKPKVLLLDEPFGALDALTRAHLQDEVMKIQKDLGNTMMMITHDVDEAVLLSDRIVMMTNGPSATIGETLEVKLPRPRDRIALADDPEYNHYRRAVLSFLHERHRLH